MRNTPREDRQAEERRRSDTTTPEPDQDVKPDRRSRRRKPAEDREVSIPETDRDMPR